MSIQSRFRTYGLYKTGKDNLGAVSKTGTFIKNIDVSISLITGSSTVQNSLISSDSSHTGIINDKSIVFDRGSILKDENFTYQIMFANYNPERFTVLYLKQVV